MVLYGQTLINVCLKINHDTLNGALYPEINLYNSLTYCRVMFKISYKLKLIFAFFKIRKSAHSHSYVKFLS
jgi:hypothetical protein